RPSSAPSTRLPSRHNACSASSSPPQLRRTGRSKRSAAEPAPRSASRRLEAPQRAMTQPLWFFANLVEVKLSQQASGNMSIVEITGPPGDTPPLHLHRNDDEAWFVLDGEMVFFVGNEDPIRVPPGGLAFGPKGVPHTYRVEGSSPARWLAICTPGDFEQFVVAASRPAERTELPPPAIEPPTDEEIA